MTPRPHGIVVIDKPEGPTSFDVVARVRKVFATREVGHCGTLDPLATGVLVVALGHYTRLVRVLTADDKRYVATVAFGTGTSTDDRAGEVVATGDAGALSAAAVGEALARFVGAQQQVPPQHSAIHIDGERAYDRARRGEVMQMPARDVVIHGLELRSFDAAAGIAVLDVHCGKGTYVRSLARDLGARLGVPAHLAALRRTASGSYGIEDACALDALERSSLRSGIDAIRGVPRVIVDDRDVAALRQGKRVHTAARVIGTALAHRADEPIALVRVEGEELVVERGFPAA